MFSQRFSSTRGGGCLPTFSGVPNACLEYMRDSKILRKAGSFIKWLNVGDGDQLFKMLWIDF